MPSWSYRSIPPSTHVFLQPRWKLVTAGVHLKHGGPQQPFKPSAVSEGKPFLIEYFFQHFVFL